MVMKDRMTGVPARDIKRVISGKNILLQTNIRPGFSV